jgi:Protein of unknown function (DUF2442)
MTTLVIDESSLRAVGAQLTDEALVVDLVDGRSVSVPLVWYPRLLRASMKERQQFRLIGSGEGIHWELLDEDVSVEGIVAARRSMSAGRGVACSTIPFWGQSGQDQLLRAMKKGSSEPWYRPGFDVGLFRLIKLNKEKTLKLITL